MFLPNFISAIPSKGATSTPSVSIARPVLIAWSSASSFVLNLYFFPFTISFAISNETISLSLIFFVTSRIFGAISFGPTSCSTLAARSKACGISTTNSGSRPFCICGLINFLERVCDGWGVIQQHSS